MRIGRSICNSVDAASRREWLVTNGIGGYASGTAAGLHTRRYHGLLVAALNPPLGRTVLLSKIEETVRYQGRTQALSTNRWADGTLEPRGFEALNEFNLEGTAAVWRFAVGDALLEKRVWMEPGANTTYIRYRVLRASARLDLDLTALLTHRDHHGTTRGDDWRMDIEPDGDGLHVLAFAGATPLYLRSDQGEWRAKHSWYWGLRLDREAERGLESKEDALAGGTTSVALHEGDDVTLCASTERKAVPDARALGRFLEHERGLLQSAGNPKDPAVRQLVLAASQFIVARATDRDPQGASVIAGYPWFGDWGRDTMIALPGLTLATGRAEVCARVLRTFGEFVDKGLLPNRFPDNGEAPKYNTADATLWYFEALRRYVEATGDWSLAQELRPKLEVIVAWHRRGTRHGIGMDPGDHLLRAGEPGVQLTWMDAKVGSRVITPRIGKPVEINALWHNALEFMRTLAERTGPTAEDYGALAASVRHGIGRFWCEQRGHCYDVIDGHDGHDDRLRPNQILLVALPHCPLDARQQRAILDACLRELYTPHGLRTLSPTEAGYAGRCEGGPNARDEAYHQGTAWGWLVGPFARAHQRVYDDPMRLRELLAPLVASLDDHGMGSVSEIFDGDPPHAPRGCIAQAWSVAELLCAWGLANETRPTKTSRSPVRVARAALRTQRPAGLSSTRR